MPTSLAGNRSCAPEISVPKESLLEYNDNWSKSDRRIMKRPNTILVYTDYKSPYAFLTKDLIYELEDQFDVHVEWLPYTLDIPSYLGSARLDELGVVIESNRNAHQLEKLAPLARSDPARAAPSC
jgi:hypothetical protein